VLSVTGAGIEDVLRGVAYLLWPLVALLAIIVFRPEIRDVLRRIRKGKFFGQEIELDKSLDRLESEVQALPDIPIPPPAPEEPDRDIEVRDSGTGREDIQLTVERLRDTRLPAESSAESDIDDIINQSGSSPRVALILLSATLERSARRLLAATGHIGELTRTPSLPQMIQLLERVTSLEPGSLDVYRNFYAIRNQIVHGRGEVTSPEILRAIDSGISLLRALDNVPRERNFVYHSGVPIYGNAEGTELLVGRAIMLTTMSPSGEASIRVFPTLRAHFQPGMEVAWEWNSGQQWGRAWYLDPDSGQLLHAWDGSMEFIGRDLDEL